ncbi:aldehyde dehydrogenase family protein [Streptosporangium sp. CA-115845]|uniref:aldehyde dehydrogenase family protein n=1 Tax=Streptosporangium sp. CA-115845 TaxID=3240071 RepID=UPI003D902BF4
MTTAPEIDLDIRAGITLPPTDLLIGGEWQPSAAGERFEVIDPVTERVIAQVARGREIDVQRAVAAARGAVDGGEWSRLSGVERGRLLFKLADLMERDFRQMTLVETLDIGQPLKNPATAIATLRYFAGWADKIDGRHVVLPDSNGRPTHTYVRREPIGVVAAITPWNSPLMTGAWKIAPALAAGCSVVVKPPEDAPLSTLYLGALALEAGFPPGAINIVPGFGAEAGAPLVSAPGVDKVTFTGSTVVGRQIGAQASGLLKAVTLELGGKSPQVVFADADIERHIPMMARQFYLNSGQVCAAGTRLLVERQVLDQVVEGVARQLEQVRVGDPFKAGTQIGSLISRKQYERVRGYIDQGRAEATLVTGGQRLGETGFFVQPALFTGTNDTTIGQEEIFGPVGLVVPFDGYEEAIRLANDTPYGLASVVYTSNLGTAHRAAADIRAGMVRINGGAGVPAPQVPFGGMKSSGLGRELSYAGIEACTVEKTVSLEI